MVLNNHLIKYLGTQLFKLNKVSFILILFNFYFTNYSIAQTDEPLEDNIVNQQIWIDFYPHYFVNDKLEYYGDFGYRSIVSKRSWNRIYARPSLKYHLNKHWEVQSGLGAFYIFNKSNADQFEITPWQGVQLNWPNFRRWHFKNQIKIEERFYYLTNNWDLNFELRFRYKLFGKYQLNEKWEIPFYLEYFLPINNDVEEFYSNKARAGLGLGYSIANEWKFSFVFNWQNSRTGPNADLTASDYAYQLKVTKNWHQFLIRKNRRIKDQ